LARLEELEGAKVALDSVIFIYALEGNPVFGELAKKILQSIEQGKCQGFVIANIRFPYMKDDFGLRGNTKFLVGCRTAHHPRKRKF